MAMLEKRGKKFRVIFRYGGQRFTRTLKTGSEKAASASVGPARRQSQAGRIGCTQSPRRCRRSVIPAIRWSDDCETGGEAIHQLGGING